MDNVGQKTKYLFPAFLLVFFFFLHMKPVNLAITDIGRHIKNGEIFVKEHKVIATNYYSYTSTDYPFRTHHWAAGVVFYLVENAGGFKLLSWFNTLLQLLALFLMYRVSRLYADEKYVLLISLMMLPLLVFRPEIRPESISYLFLAISYVLLMRYDANKLSYKWILPSFIIIQVLWVNMHIYFILNIALAGAFMMKAFLNKEKFRNYLVLFVVLIPCSMASPFGIHAFLEPFTIFRDFEMQISEMQPVPLLENGSLYGNAFFYYYKITFFIALLFILLNMSLQYLKENLHFILLFIFFSILGWAVNRMVTVFGYLMIPFIALNFSLMVKNRGRRVQILGYSMVFYLIFNLALEHASKLINMFGAGQEDREINEAAYFFKRNKLPGPILNNMNNGSYLIYHLFPGYRVFYDARPEAYPAAFIKEVYRSMLQDETAWKQRYEQYRFRSIFFYTRTMTDYERKFLERRLSDPQWRAVYNDKYFLILIRQ